MVEKSDCERWRRDVNNIGCIAERDDMHNEDEYRQLEAENKKLKQLLKENGIFYL